jgi:hypothetical protein
VAAGAGRTEVPGTVAEQLPKALYRVTLDSGHEATRDGTSSAFSRVIGCSWRYRRGTFGADGLWSGSDSLTVHRRPSVQR